MSETPTMRRGRAMGGMAARGAEGWYGGKLRARAVSLRSQGSGDDTCRAWGSPRIECCFSTCSGFPLGASRRPQCPPYGARAERQAFCGARLPYLDSCTRSYTPAVCCLSPARRLVCQHASSGASGCDWVRPQCLSFALHLGRAGTPAPNNVRLSLRCASSIRLVLLSAREKNSPSYSTLHSRPPSHSIPELQYMSRVLVDRWARKRYFG